MSVDPIRARGSGHGLSEAPGRARVPLGRRRRGGRRRIDQHPVQAVAGQSGGRDGGVKRWAATVPHIVQPPQLPVFIYPVAPLGRRPGPPLPPAHPVWRAGAGWEGGGRPGRLFHARLGGGRLPGWEGGGWEGGGSPGWLRLLALCCPPCVCVCAFLDWVLFLALCCPPLVCALPVCVFHPCVCVPSLCASRLTAVPCALLPSPVCVL